MPSSRCKEHEEKMSAIQVASLSVGNRAANRAANFLVAVDEGSLSAIPISPDEIDGIRGKGD